MESLLTLRMVWYGMCMVWYGMSMVEEHGSSNHGM